jgi:hypothetical protein
MVGAIDIAHIARDVAATHLTLTGPGTRAKEKPKLQEKWVSVATGKQASTVCPMCAPRLHQSASAAATYTSIATLMPNQMHAMPSHRRSGVRVPLAPPGVLRSEARS